MDVTTRLAEAISRSRSSASDSESAAARLSGSRIRIDSGTISSSNASIVGTPSAASILSASLDVGPRWRSANNDTSGDGTDDWRGGTVGMGLLGGTGVR